MDEERIPVVVAAGQVTVRDRSLEGLTTIGLAEDAARAALDQVGALAATVERLSFVGALSRVGPSPAGALARRLGLGEEVVVETTGVGGNNPQWLVTRAAGEIAEGRLGTTVIAGGEALAGPREERWSRGAETGEGSPEGALAPDPVVGDQRPGVSPQEGTAGVMLPAHIYPMLESARAARLGRTLLEHRRHLGELMAPFSAVAARHPNAWFRKVRTAQEIATPGPDNRLIAEPYPLLMNAILRVNQGAALVVTSLAEARRAGVAERAVFVWSGADAHEVWFVPQRPDLTRSPAIAAAGAAALGAAGVGVDELARIDLYSCFPIAVEMAAEALGLAVGDERGLTVTGGLPYFGGPGNNYTTHAIATLTDLLRQSGGLGLASGLGWFATKHAVGIYGSEPPPGGFRVGDTRSVQAAIDGSALALLDSAEGSARVDGATVVYDREGQVSAAPIYARVPGARVVARAAPEVLGALRGVNLVGRMVRLVAGEGGGPPAYHVEDLSGEESP